MARGRAEWHDVYVCAYKSIDSGVGVVCVCDRASTGRSDSCKSVSEAWPPCTSTKSRSWTEGCMEKARLSMERAQLSDRKRSSRRFRRQHVACLIRQSSPTGRDSFLCD
eukprot:6212934-Pleurochrysis_carterae.AAC.1